MFVLEFQASEHLEAQLLVQLISWHSSKERNIYSHADRFFCNTGQTGYKAFSKRDVADFVGKLLHLQRLVRFCRAVFY